MKLFRDKNRGPKTRSEDVVIPEEYLEYEREAEARRQREAAEMTEKPEDGSLESELSSDAFSLRVEQLLNTDKESLTSENDEPVSKEEETAAAVASVLENIFNDVRAANATETDQGASVMQDEPPAEEETPAADPRTERRKKRRRSSEKKQQDPQAELPLGFKIILTMIVLIVAAVVALLGPLMRIDSVQVNDLQYMTEEQVVEIAGAPVGQNLFLYRTSRAEEELSYYPYVQNVVVTRHFPHWIGIEITERQPAGVLLNNGSYLQFSKDGVLLDNTKTLTHLNLPLITGFSMKDVPSPGEAFKDNERFNDILKIVNACSDELLTMIQEINIEDRSNILAYTSQGLEIRIGGVDDIEARMAALNDIMNQVILSGIVEEPIEAIDIRYAKSPVIVLEGYDNIDASELLDDNDETAGGETSSAQTQQQTGSQGSQTTQSSSTTQQSGGNGAGTYTDGDSTGQSQTANDPAGTASQSVGQ